MGVEQFSVTCAFLGECVVSEVQRGLHGGELIASLGEQRQVLASVVTGRGPRACQMVCVTRSS